MHLPLDTVIITTVDFFFKFLSVLIMIRIFMSWLSPGVENALTRFVYTTTEPILAAFRLLPLRIGMIDFTPIAALLTIDYLLNPLAVELTKRLVTLIANNL